MAMLKPGDGDHDDQVGGFQTAYRHEPEPREGDGAVPYREATYVLRLIDAGQGELPMEEIRPALAEIFDVVQDDTLGRAISFLYGISTPPEHTAEIRPPEMRVRLAGIKSEWDPHNLFRAGPEAA